MKNLFLILLIAVLSQLFGCATAPKKAPTTAEEVATMGKKNLLSVPADISKFNWSKFEVVALNGDKGRITLFTDPQTGKNYDEDGQPVNEKGYRILNDGYVCEVLIITSLGGRAYNGRGVFFDDEHLDFCRSNRQLKRFQNAQRVGLTGAALAVVTGGASILASMGSNVVSSLTEDDTL